MAGYGHMSHVKVDAHLVSRKLTLSKGDISDTLAHKSRVFERQSQEQRIRYLLSRLHLTVNE